MDPSSSAGSSSSAAKPSQTPEAFLESCVWALIDAREDAALSTLLGKMLYRVIRLVGDAAHRGKALEVIKTVSARVKTSPSVVLPVAQLLKSLTASDSTPFERNFAMVFLELGWRRSPPSELGSLALDILPGLSKHAPPHQPALLHMFLSSIEHIDLQVAAAVTSSLPRQDSQLLTSFLLEVMLYTHTSTPKDSPNDPPPLPRGLSADGLARLESKCQCVGDAKPYLLGRKLAVAKAVCEHLLAPEDALPILLVAVHGPHSHEVRKVGEEGVKWRVAKADFESDLLLKELFTLVLGTPQQAPGSAGVEQGKKREACDVLVRHAAVGMLGRSVKAANSFPLTLQLIFECIYGKQSNTKLKQVGMQFAVWTLRNSESHVLAPMAGVLLSGLIKFLDTMDGDLEGGQQAIAQLRGFTFSAIGQLAQRVPKLFSTDIGVAKMLFGALSTEMPEIRVSVQEAVSLSCVAYQSVSGDAKEELMKLLVQSVSQDSHQARFCAVYWANRLFPFSDARARHINLLAVDDKKVEVREEAARGLIKPASSKVRESLIPEQDKAIAQGKDQQTYPTFVAMLAHLSSPSVVSSRRTLSTPIKAAMVSFCRECLAHSALEEGEVTRSVYLSESRGSERTEAASRFHSLIEDALASSLSTGAKRSVNDTALAKACFVALIDLFGARRDIVAGEYGGKLQWLESFLFCNSEETRELVASVLGQIAVDMTRDQASGIVTRMLSLDEDDSASVEQRQGCLLALGYLAASAAKHLEASIKSKVVERLYAAMAETKRIEVATSACRAVGLVGLEESLPVPEGAMEEDGNKDEGGEVTVLRIVDRLGQILSGKEKESKVYDSAAYALGSLCVSCRSEPVITACLDKLFAASKLLRVEELQLCVGEAIACVAGARRYTAASLLCQLRLPSAYEDQAKDAEKAAEEWARAGQGPVEEGEGCVLDKVMTRIMDGVLQDAKPQVRAAGAPYLLCLVKYCGVHPLIQERLKLVQQHFSFMLSEKSEFMQEVASKGIGLVYDMCSDDTIKDELVATLAKGLMSGTIEAPSKMARPDDEDAELFEDGGIKIDDKALGGGSMTTYKELCTVATELGQPELIYKFLNLAGHQKVWNSRRGAAFGFSTIAGKAADRLKPHLPKLIPKLYRYQFDPNERIQEAMGSLWQMVVTDPDKAKLEYLDDILLDLLPSVGSRLWRVREASCLAIADLMSGKRFEHVEKHLIEIYRMSLRAMDDVKETVRIAGTTLNRAVSGLSCRLCDAEQSGEAIAGKTLGMLLPFLLEEGINQTAAEVRVASIHQMVKVVKGAGPSLRPFIADIAVVLIESLSSLEPMMNTYVQQHAERMDAQVAEKFERARLSASRNTPLTETLELCLRVIDEEGADATLPRLVPIIRSGVGLPTRCGVAKFVSSLAFSHATRKAVAKHSSKVLKALATGLEDRSQVVRHAMASCAGRVFAVAKEAACDEYVSHLVEMHEQRGAEDASVRACVALAFKELMNSASDQMKSHHSDVLPIAFMARYDSDEAAKECWEQVWTEGAGSTSAGVRMHMSEMATIIPKHLSSTSWETRRTAAVACKEFAETLGGSVGPHLLGLMGAVEECVKGRVWDGKEEVLGAMAALAVAGKAKVREEQGMAKKVASLLFGECGKKRKEYRIGALRAAKKLCSEFKEDVGGAGGLMVCVKDLWEKDAEVKSEHKAHVSAGRDADAEEQYEARMEERGKEEVRAIALECVHEAWVCTLCTDGDAALACSWSFAALQAGSLPERTSAVALVSSIAGDQGKHFPGGLAAEAISGLIKCMRLPGQQHHALHAAAAKSAAAIVKGGGGDAESLRTLREAADGMLGQEGKPKQEAQSLLGALHARMGGDVEMKL